jgi:hypothetical protein
MAVAPLPAPAPPAGNAQANPNRRDRRFVAVLNGSLLLATVVPLAIASWQIPTASVFTGYLVIARDAFVYQALWRAGWSGAWLFHPLYSGEPQPGILIYPWYLWTGHVVGALSGPWLYHTLRLAAGAALLRAIWSLTATFYRPSPVRRWAFLLAALGGGVGAFLPLNAHLGPLPLRATESLVSGTSAADILSMAPHLAWAAALLCWVFTACLRWTRVPDRRWLAGGLAALIGLELIYPQLAMLAIATMLGWAMLRRRRRGLLFAEAATLAAAPYLVYLAWAHARVPSAFIGIGATAQVPFHFDVGDPFGFVVLSHLVATALIAVAIVMRRLRGDLFLPAVWIVVVTAFMFVPFARTIVGRSYLASSIPFGILAAAGLVAFLRRLPRGPWRRRGLLLALAGSSLFGIVSLVEPYAIAGLQLDPRAEYERQGEAAVLQWLAPRSTAQDLVLTTYLDGVFVPAQTNARAYVGHPDQTVDVVAKADAAVAYFSSWDVSERDAFLRSNGIDYVLARDLTTAARLRDDPRLRAVHSAGGDTLFQVVP